jgi:Raf kinase inhibitor-like YbhB/YbcL family protein
LLTVRILLATIILGIFVSGDGLAGQPAGLVVSSPAFANAGVIPKRYTCTGEDTSPPLNWRGVPSDAKTLALVVDDPDAPSGTFTHWIVYNLPHDSRGLPENALKPGPAAVDYPQALNDFGHLGYNGPCPPRGTRHHYHFKLYALAAALHLPRDATVKQLDKAMRGQILAVGQMIATYER